jgi:hypothetical protein
VTREIALDPGGTTGYLYCTDGVRVYQHQMGPQEHHEDLWKVLNDYNPEVIIYETFQYRNGLEKAILVSCEYIGIIRLWGMMNPSATLVPQTPAVGKGFWTDDKLKKLGLYRTGAPHAMDATRHWLQYRAFTLKEKTWLEKLR